MGNHLVCGLGCAGPCGDQCCSLCARDRCTAVCLGDRQKPVVQTVSAVHEGAPPPPPERYDLPGAECSGSRLFCGDDGGGDGGDETLPLPEDAFGCGPAERRMLEEAVLDLEERAVDRDMVMPMAFGPPGVPELPNLGPRVGIEALADECRFNAGKLAKVRRLAKAYEHWRPVRGDGNCYYRTVVFGALEALLAAGDRFRVADALEQVSYASPREQRAHEEMLRRLRSWSTLGQLEERVTRDPGLDQALIRACRRLVRIFLMEQADKASPSGLTYSELVRALDVSYAGVEDFCARVVDPMGIDAETLVIDVLPKQLGVGLRVWLLDRREGVDLVPLDTPGPEGSVQVHVLFKPGHYDLLYPRKVEPGSRSAPPADPVKAAAPSDGDRGRAGHRSPAPAAPAQHQAASAWGLFCLRGL
mmetsp:Transcript_7963/g.23636  ORF Transcript_7963/g.23636 Transcript_7963/m.23636 type:complete len:417 (+) Transcript_7963:52-1302(+)